MGLEQKGATELSEAQSKKDYWKDGFCAATNTTQNDLADQLVSHWDAGRSTPLFFFTDAAELYPSAPGLSV